VHRRTRRVMKAFLLGMAGKDPLHRADTPYPVLGRHEPAPGEFVGDEPIPLRWVVGMVLQGGVDEMGVLPVPLGDRLREPLVVGLPGDPRQPTTSPRLAPAQEHRPRPVHGRAGTLFSS
jgi:hypothetical protein